MGKSHGTFAAAKPQASPASGPKKHTKLSGRPRRGAAKPAAIPSFAFVANRDAQGGLNSTDPHPSAASVATACGAQQMDTNAGTSATGEVEAFVTIAGRAGKGGSVTRRVSIAEIERMVPVSFLPNLLPTQFADHLLRVFMEETKRWHTSKRWLYDKEIESHRLGSGFRFDNTGRVGGHRWETAGFGDDLRHLRFVVAGAVQRARAELRQGWRASRQAGSHPGSTKPYSESDLAQETVVLASRGHRLSAESVEWLMKYAREYKEHGWRWAPNYVVANCYVDAG